MNTNSVQNLNFTASYYRPEEVTIDILFQWIDQGGLKELRNYIKDSIELPLDVVNSAGDTLVLAAIKADQIEIAELLIDNDFDYISSDMGSHTPLYFAADKEHISLIKILINKSQFNAVNDSGCSEIDNVLGKFIEEEKNAAFVSLIKSGINFNNILLFLYSIQRLNVEIMVYLLDTTSIDIEILHKMPFCMLIYEASLKGNWELIFALLDRGLSIKMPFVEWAINTNRLDICKLLVDRGAVITEELVEKSVEIGHKEIFEYLYYHLVDKNFSINKQKLFMNAIEHSKVDIARFLSQQEGVDIHVRDHMGMTLLMQYIGRFHTDMWCGFRPINPISTELIKFLIEVDNGESLEIRYDGDTPLMKAVRLNLCEIAKILLEKGANLNAYRSNYLSSDNDSKVSVLSIAINSLDDVNLINLLIEHGAYQSAIIDTNADLERKRQVWQAFKPNSKKKYPYKRPSDFYGNTSLNQALTSSAYKVAKAVLKEEFKLKGLYYQDRAYRDWILSECFQRLERYQLSREKEVAIYQETKNELGALKSLFLEALKLAAVLDLGKNSPAHLLLNIYSYPYEFNSCSVRRFYSSRTFRGYFSDEKEQLWARFDEIMEGCLKGNISIDIPNEKGHTVRSLSIELGYQERLQGILEKNQYNRISLQNQLHLNKLKNHFNDLSFV